MRALIGGSNGEYQLTDNLKIPTPKRGTMLCRVHAVALNPSDAKMADFAMTEGAVGGADFAGIVIEVGEQVTRFVKGDRIFALAFGLNPADVSSGAFAEYALATEDLAGKIPRGMSFAQACGMGVAVGTAGMAIFQELGLPMPGIMDGEKMKPLPVLVSGGATSSGTMAIQLLRCAGMIPIATCSPGNYTLCKSFGAVACFDYHSPTCGADIRMHTNNELAHILDCATDAATMTMCYEAMGQSGGRYVALEAFPTAVQYTRRDVKATWILGSSLFGEEVKFAGAYGRPACKTHREFAGKLYPLMEEMLANSLIKNHPISILQGGLGGLVDGIEQVRKGKVRATKLVFPLFDAEDK